MRQDRRAYKNLYTCRFYIKRKEIAVAYKGGSCILCGYNKCINALVFHHRDPSTKEGVWNVIKKQSRDKMYAELDKCDLLCSNCHAETHFKLEAVGRTHPFTPRSVTKPSAVCDLCDQEFKPRNGQSLHCGKKCYNIAKGKRYPEDGIFVSVVKEIGKSAAGRKYGVSDKMIAKRFTRISEKCLSDHKKD